MGIHFVEVAVGTGAELVEAKLLHHLTIPVSSTLSP